jgi:hypothetical protein
MYFYSTSTHNSVTLVNLDQISPSRENESESLGRQIESSGPITPHPIHPAKLHSTTQDTHTTFEDEHARMRAYPDSLEIPE